MKSKTRLLALTLPLVIAFSWLSITFWDAPLAIACRSLDKRYRFVFALAAALGHSAFYLIASAAAFLYLRFVQKSKHYSLFPLFIFVAIAASGLTADALKFILGRSRPSLLIKENVYFFRFFQIESDLTSFPSGHSATIVSLMMAFYFLYPKYKILYILMATIVSASRVIITAHYLSDVVFGAYLAVVVTPFVKHLFEKHGARIFPGAEKSLLAPGSL